MEKKPGTKTTEFWIAIAPVILGLVEGFKGDTELTKYLIVCGTALGFAYILSRTFIKVKS